MQANGVNPPVAPGYGWQQGMFVTSNPVYMGTTRYSDLQPVAIHTRHAQALPSYQPAPVMSAPGYNNQLSELRKTLIDQVVWHLSSAGHHSGLPLLAGAFAQACRRQCQRVINPLSGAEERTAVVAEQLLDCPLMHIATTVEMGNMMLVMDWLLHKEKRADSSLQCGVTHGSFGEQVFSWFVAGQPLFSIGVLALRSAVGLDILVQDYQTSDGHRLPLRTSRTAAAVWLNEQLHSGLSGPPCSSIIRELQGLAIAATGSADYPKPVLWQKPSLSGQEVPTVVQPVNGQGVAACPSVMQPVNGQGVAVCPSVRPSSLPLPGYPMVPGMLPVLAVHPAAVSQTPAALRGAGTEQPGVKYSSPRDDAVAEHQWVTEELVTPPEAGPDIIRNEVVLRKHQDVMLDLGFSLIRNHFSSRGYGSKAQTTSAFSSLAINKNLVGLLQDLVGTEAGDLAYHSLLRCPYLGTAQCYYMKAPPDSGTARQEKLVQLIEELLPQMCQTVIDAGELPFEKLDELRALIVVLMLKYLMYMPETGHQLNALLIIMADLIDAECNRLIEYEPGAGATVLRLVPQAFLVVLNSAEIRGRQLSSAIERRIVSSLTGILRQSKRHGCYEIVAAVVSLLPRLPLQSTLPSSGLKESVRLGQGVQDAFKHFHELLHVRAPSLLHRLSVARTILELSDSLDAAPATQAQSYHQWLTAIGGHSDGISDTVDSAQKVLGADEMAFKRAVREFAQSDQREREAVRQQWSKAAAKSADAQPWELQLAKAVEMFRQSGVVKAEQFRGAALASAGGDKINQSRIWVECGSALLEPYREIIALSITLSNKADGYKRQLERICQDIPRAFLHRQSHDAVTNAWLVDNNYTIPKERSLIVLADHVPTPNTISLLIKALNTTVNMYKQAVEILRQCSAAELQDRASCTLRTMELDLSRLIENGSGLVAPSRSVANVLAIRYHVLKQLGFLEERHPLQGVQSTIQGGWDVKAKQQHYWKAKQQLYWRSAYARASERICREIKQLAPDQGSVERWVEVKNAIDELRCKLRA